MKYAVSTSIVNIQIDPHKEHTKYVAGEESELKSLESGVAVHGNTLYQGFNVDPSSTFYKQAKAKQQHEVLQQSLTAMPIPQTSSSNVTSLQFPLRMIKMSLPMVPHAPQSETNSYYNPQTAKVVGGKKLTRRLSQDTMSFINMNSEDMMMIIGAGDAGQTVEEQALEETLNITSPPEGVTLDEDGDSPISCIKQSISLATFTDEH